MKTTIVALMVLLTTTGLVKARGPARGEGRSCRAEVLKSEELPAAALFQHAIRATVLVTGADARHYETTIYQVIPWQVPPLRRGQLVRVACDPPASEAAFPLF